MNDFLSGLTERAAKNNPPSAGDYVGDDGLLRCGVCGAPKQTEIDGVKVSCICDCKKAERDRETERKRQADNDSRRKLCFTSPLLETYRIDDADKTKSAELARRFIQHWAEMKEDGTGLLLWGNVGTGKTFIAAAIANAVIDLGESARMRSTGEIVLEVQSGPNKIGIIDEICRPSLLVLDDLGAERETSFGAEIVYTVIDRRYQTGRPLIVTTNIPLQEIKTETDSGKSRLYSRILDRCIPIFVDGPDRRKAEGAERLKRARELFG